MEDSNSRIELVGSGSVEMLTPFLDSFGDSLGITIYPEYPRTNHMRQVFRVLQDKENEPRIEFGLIELQQLPNQRVLITFHVTPRNHKPEDVTEQQKNMFTDFINKLYARMVQLGFATLPSPPKRAMGFISNQDSS